MQLEKRNQLIARYLPLVKKIAKLHKNKIIFLSQVSLDDLIAAGNLALVEAANHYKEEMGSFGSYAKKRIYGEMNDEINRHSYGPKRKGFVTYQTIDEGDPSLFYEENHEESIFEILTKILPTREVWVLRWHFADEMTYKQIGNKIGVKESRVSQLLSENINKLRNAKILTSKYR